MTHKQAVSILKGVRDLLADPNHWTQDEWARAADGGPCDADAPRATCWCLGGAFWKITGDEGFSYSEEPWGADVIEAWGRLADVVEESPFSFNDGSTHAQVIAALDEAIAEATA